MRAELKALLKEQRPVSFVRLHRMMGGTMRISSYDFGTAATGLVTALAFAAIIAFTWGGVVAPYSARELVLGGTPETVGYPIPRN